MRIRTIVSSLVLAAIISAGSSAAVLAQGQAADKIVVRFTWKLKGEYAPLFVAQDKGYYKAEGLNVELAEGSGAQTVLRVVASGQEPFAYGPAVAAAQAVSQDLPVKVVAMYQTRAPMGVISFPDVPLATPKDLEGKTLAVSVGETFSDMLGPFAKINKIDVNAIKKVQMDNSARTTQFLTRRVDLMAVYLSNELPKMEQTAGKAFNVLKISDFGMNLPGASIVVNTDFAAKNGEVVRKLLAATQKGYADAMKDPVEATRIMAKYMTVKEDPAVLEKQVRATVESTNAPAGKPIGWQDITTWNESLDLLLETGAIKTRKDAGAYFTNEYMP